MLLIALLYLLCASSFTIAKAALLYGAPVFFVGFRMTLAGLLLLAFMRYKKDEWKVIAAKDRLLFAIIIFFHVYLAYVLDMYSLQYLTSFKSSFLFNSSPFITALISYFWLGDRMNRNKWLGLAIGCVGLLPMLLKENSLEQMAGQLLFLSVPEMMVLLSVVSSCVGWIAMKRLMQHGYGPLQINGVGMLCGGIFALVTSWHLEHWDQFNLLPVTDWSRFLALTLLIIVVCNVAFYNLYAHLLKKYSATFLSFAGFVTPLFTALFGIFWLHEEITWHFFVSMFLVSAGLYCFYKQELL